MLGNGILVLEKAFYEGIAKLRGWRKRNRRAVRSGGRDRRGQRPGLGQLDRGRKAEHGLHCLFPEHAGILIIKRKQGISVNYYYYYFTLIPNRRQQRRNLPDKSPPRCMGRVL